MAEAERSCTGVTDDADSMLSVARDVTSVAYHCVIFFFYLFIFFFLYIYISIYYFIYHFFFGYSRLGFVGDDEQMKAAPSLDGDDNAGNSASRFFVVGRGE